MALGQGGVRARYLNGKGFDQPLTAGATSGRRIRALTDPLGRPYVCMYPTSQGVAFLSQLGNDCQGPGIRG